MPETAFAKYDLSRLNVLVVDDSMFMRNLVESILRALRVGKVILSADAAEALVTLSQEPVDMVFVDWVMEPLDGLDFTRLVRTGKDSPNTYLPVIMMTGHTELWRIHQARDAGVNEFIAKPLSAKTLYQRVVSVIENPRPFVRTRTFFGPDRRRKNVGPPKGVSERRASVEAAA